MKGLLSLIMVLITIIALGSGQNIQDIECPFPEGQMGQNQTLCEMYTACQWETDTNNCHMRSNSEIGYRIASQEVALDNGFMVDLEPVDPSKMMYGPSLSNLRLYVIYHSETHLQIKIVDTKNARYEVPVPYNFPAVSNITQPESYSVNIRGGPNNDILVLNVTRSNGNIIFKSVGPITFEDQFIQFTTQLQSTYLYGFGENNHDSFRHQFQPRVTQPIFTRDQGTLYANINSYGAHPYHMVIEDDVGNSHSIFFVNSNAMEYSTFMMDEGSLPGLTYRTIGGVVDLHFFMGPTPEEVNQQYLSVIGYPNFPPYTALGFHLSRWGYRTTSEIQTLVENLHGQLIPMDGQFFDIDYMDGRRDFTVDTDNFGDVAALITTLHNQENIKSTVILDPAQTTEFSSCMPAQRGLWYDAYVHWADLSYVPPTQPAGAGDLIVGHVWPVADAVFPDYMKSDAQDWWVEEIKMLHDDLNFDYLWIDMNEPSNFDTDIPLKLQCPKNKYEDPPYPTMAAYGPDVISGRISDRTLCMSAVQRFEGVSYSHYNVHSLYGWSQAEPSYRAMATARPGKRQFVLSRSTFPGSGKYVNHWLGDNNSTFEQMRKSIIGILEFNMFGFPFIGADVCGFNGDSYEELCTRWTQLGAFYPFNRNHNSYQSIDQDPLQWDSVKAAAQGYYRLRYQYNPYLYFLLHMAHMHGATVVRPLFNEFPSDVPCRDIDDQFLWGDSLMVAPVLTEGAVNRDVYFPKAIWYNLETGECVNCDGKAATMMVDAPLAFIPLYIRGGKIVPWQSMNPADVTLTATRDNDFGLTVAIDENDMAMGQIFWDDGETEYESPMESAFMADVVYNMNNITVSINHGNEVMNGINMMSMVLYGYTNGDISSVKVNDGTGSATVSSTGYVTITVNAPLNEDIVLTLTN